MDAKNLKPSKNGKTKESGFVASQKPATEEEIEALTKQHEQDEHLEKLFASENNKPKKVDAMVKINVVLPKHHHKKFKTYCLIEDIKMQQHLQKLIVNYINTLPDYIK